MNKPFIKYLGEKLKTGSLRSIHLNALPNRYLTRLDITKLDMDFVMRAKSKSKNPRKPSHRFLFENLLKKEEFKYEISLSDVNYYQDLNREEKKQYNFVYRRMNSLFNQAEDNYLEHGIKTFSFGYPILVKRSKTDPKRILKAPIFIWSLELNRSSSSWNKWTIVKTADAPVYINEVLISQIAQDEGIKMSNLHPEYLEDGLVDKFEIAEIVDEIINHFRTFKSKIKPELEPFPSAKVINEQSSTPFIQWSGVFGLFKTQKQSIIQDIEKLSENFDNSPIEFKEFKQSKNTSVLTDPSQQEIIHSIYNSECKVIQGPPGTGKSQSLTAIITNGLENLKKILVVCEKKTALEVIENNLKELGLGELCVTIDDVNRDRRKVIDRVRKPNDISKLIQGFYDRDYNNKAKLFDELTESYNAKHHQLLKPLLNNKNIKELIGQFIELQRRGFELRYCFHGMVLDYSDKEYQDLSLIVSDGAILFKGVHEKHFAFDEFFKHRFLKNYSIDVEKEFFADIDQVEELMQEYLDNWEALTFKEMEIAENYLLKHSTWMNIKAIFSKSTKVVFKHWKETKKLFDDIEKALKKHQLLSFDLKWDETTEDLKPIHEHIKEMRWLVGEVMQLKPRFRNYFQWRNFYESQYIVYRQVFDKLHEIEPNPSNWLPVFQMEYINRFIENQETTKGFFNVDNLELNKISKLQSKIRTSQKDKILTYWIDIRRKAIRKYNQKNNINWLYNYRRNKMYSKANSLRKIVDEDFELFSSVFPVILVNPTVCSSVLPLEKGLFDLVIFDEASQLRLEDTFAAFYRGKTKVISGDKQQMPPSSYFSTDIILEALEEMVEEETTSNQDLKEEHPLFLAESESLLAFGNNLNMEHTNVSYLDFHYRSKHPHLIDFSNAAFYGKRLVPLPPVEDYQPIRFIAVNGLYQEAQNLDEAKKVVEIIRNEIQPNEAGEFPTLGIATFNLKQRNIIKDTIYNETIEDEVFRLKMEAIGKTESWFVKNLENVQGDERDIIIISTTFGVNANERFIQNFGPINNYEKGYKLLNVIITRAKKKLYILTSIPEEKYTKYQPELEKKGNKGKAIFYAYLDYCRTVEQGNERRRQDILRLVARNSEDLLHYEQHEETAFPQFEQEIFRYLSDYVKPQFIEKQYPLGGYQIDFVIKDQENKPVIAIECDGTDWHKTNEAYIYDIHRQKIIEGMGLKYHRIWSRNWFPNPNHAAISLVAMIADTMPFVMEKVKMSDYSDAIDSFVSKLSEKNEN